MLEVDVWLAGLEGEDREVAEALVREQNFEMADGGRQMPESFVSMSLDAVPDPEGQGPEAILRKREFTEYSDRLKDCPHHGMEWMYVTDARGEYRCRMCDRASRRKSYSKSRLDPAFREKERLRQKAYRARKKAEKEAARESNLGGTDE